jgi:hypothetical protein
MESKRPRPFRALTFILDSRKSGARTGESVNGSAFGGSRGRINELAYIWPREDPMTSVRTAVKEQLTVAIYGFGVGHSNAVAALEFDQERVERAPPGKCSECEFEVICGHTLGPGTSRRIALTSSQANSTKS